MRIITLILFLTLAFNDQLLSQVIHKNDLENFTAILKTSSPNTPRNLHRDSVYIRNAPLETTFTDYFVEYVSDLDEKYPLSAGNGVRNTRLRFNDDISRSRILEFHGTNEMVVLFSNNEHENGTYYLTNWKKVGDSLHFEKLHPNPILVGIGNAKIDLNYKKDSKQNKLFIVIVRSPDMGWDGGSYHLFQLSRYGHFYEIWSKEYYTDLQGPSGTEHIVAYKFLIGSDFLVQEYWYDIETKIDEDDPYRTEYLVRTLTGSKLELIDLRKIVELGY